MVKKAKEIVAFAVANRERWGKHAGFGPYSEDDVMDALVELQKDGFLDFQGDDRQSIRDELTKANRQTAAANARATKYKNQYEASQERVKELVIALEESENANVGLQMQLEGHNEVIE